jgi:hypothetical protein
MAQIPKDNIDYDLINYEDIVNCKKVSENVLTKEWERLKKLKCDENSRAFAGNKIIYNFMFKHLLRVRRDIKNYDLLEEIFNDPEKKKYWIDMTLKINRRDKADYINATDIYECYRRCRGGVVVFKSITAKYLYKRFNATKVLDPTAGWGGRLLGARALGLEYTGIDTNINLKDGYDEIQKRYGGEMIWASCLDVNFENIEYDFVLTSPPYYNLEQYENMELFKSEEEFYKLFMIVLIEKCLKYIKNNGAVCFNVSDYMYEKYINYGGRECVEKIDLLQQMGGKKNKELVYVFRREQTD